MTDQEYSVSSAFDALTHTLHQYLRASYHVWDEDLISERDRLLAEPGITFQAPYLEATPVYRSGRAYSELKISNEAARLLGNLAGDSSTGIPPRPYSHQAAALEIGVSSSDDMVVATGTGSGKTESFLMPIVARLLGEATARPSSWERRGVRALLLYPMNALVNDQLARLRRLLGSPAMVEAFAERGVRHPTFGMYTSRAPYPGPRTAEKDKRQVIEVLQRLYIDGMTPELQSRLTAEGKWPAKDLRAFVDAGLQTSPADSELITRHEMQTAAPDLLVTNYSMLEYMMLRPIESQIFDSTREWLHADADNRLMLILDEAHMYRGSGGAEVAYLLRRLQARLEVPRERLQYILTSASLGSSEEARDEIKSFAARLTGGVPERVQLVTSVLLDREPGRPATEMEAEVLGAFDATLLAETARPEERMGALSGLAGALGVEGSTPEGSGGRGVRDFVFHLLEGFAPARFAATLLSSESLTFAEWEARVFPPVPSRGAAAEVLLALMAFGRDAGSSRPFCSVRSHMFFRGFPGLYACINPLCTEREAGATSPTLLGRLFNKPRLSCRCGARVYELLTHRSCGAAYLRAFARADDGNFLWHEPSSGVLRQEALEEGQYFVLSDANAPSAEGRPIVWLHIFTGRLRMTPPDGNAQDFLPVVRPHHPTRERGRPVWSLDECPACRQSARPDTPLAMDLVTKGEAPFAHLVRTQVAIQPHSKPPTAQTPNSGKKNLIFSDGRQKAARLARDIPREIELDVFRQAIFMAARELANIGKEPRLDRRLYAAFVKVVSDNHLTFFDGDDRRSLEADVKEFRTYCESDLSEAIDHFDQLRPAYSALLLKQLCSSHYSFTALTLGFVMPDAKASRAIAKTLRHIGESELKQVCVAWLHRLVSRQAFQASLPLGVRFKASPYPHQPTKASAIFSNPQKATLQRGGLDPEAISLVLSELLGEERGGGIYINPKKVVLQPALESSWAQCEHCKNVAPLPLLGHCALCGSRGPLAVNPDVTTYLRARKGFWRDPVVMAVGGDERPMSIDVQEHSAQLSYKDEQAPTPTTEEYERRFRDILKEGERAVDVLSCTTTMEVGIDIGSLLAVSMRNVPPMRQNYQQRAGRAGRRGSAVSTVTTFAQSGAHDSFYFDNPVRILSGDPPKPILDTNNGRIAERHVHAQLLQDYFKPLAGGSSSGSIYTALGDTWTFFNSAGPGTLADFKEWTSLQPGLESVARAQAWLPKQFDAEDITNRFLMRLSTCAPTSRDRLDSSLLEFLFGAGVLPSYAFPRDLCTLTIQEQDRRARGGFRTVEQAQQSMSVALSEYAPGRLVVVNKMTYRVGSVAANTTGAETDRAVPLFEAAESYRHCADCSYTAGFGKFGAEAITCPQCGADALKTMTVIRPEVVYPRGRSEIGEFDDEQVFSQVTQAQLPLATDSAAMGGASFGTRAIVASQRGQTLVMVNKGDSASPEDGFDVCESCGKVLLADDRAGPHDRDYFVQRRGSTPRCNGTYRRVLLGYRFQSDVLLIRIRLDSAVRYDATSPRLRRPLEDALQSLSEALVLAVGRILDIDAREVSAGYRFGADDAGNFADVFMYDTLAGGAGYAFEAGNQFPEIFSSAVAALDACDCAASCEQCLRHYGNRFHHSTLDRHLALQLASYITTGQMSVELDDHLHQEALTPLAGLLRLAGWRVECGPAGCRAECGSRRFMLSLVPSLCAHALKEKSEECTRYWFTPYELSRDLPAVYAELE